MYLAPPKERNFEMLVDPKTVVSPKGSVKNLHIVWDGGAFDPAKSDWSGWSLALLVWDGYPAVGVRWNGDPNGPGVGNPQSRGLPTWFILPKPLGEVVIECVSEHMRGGTTPEALTPRRRLLDLIGYVRAASDDELMRMLDHMELPTRHENGARADSKTRSPSTFVGATRNG
jgi:hypothetical protein